MNASFLLLCAIVYFLVAYFLYGGFLKRLFGIEKNNPTPAHSMEDGVDYVPSPTPVLFGHHFASIAGAGPITGPIVAAVYGWLPGLLWVLLGCVFIGAMHDFAAMFLSVRNQGRSIAYVIEKEIGYAGRQIFLFFCLAALILVVTVFTLMVADGFIATPAVATSSLLFIGMAPFFGILLNRKLLSLVEGTLIFVPLLFFFIWLGTVCPLDMVAVVGSAKTARVVWIIALLYYAFIASVIPVWFLLQPRDYLNSYLLYAMMGLAVGGILAYQPTLVMPAVEVAQGSKAIPGILPLLFVTIACGACSGFHALVASGTSSKQVDKEKNILAVGYGGMLLEGVLAIIAIISVAYMGMPEFREMISGPDKIPPQLAFARGLSHFATALGIKQELAYNFCSLAISAFILTSLDTATRLSRFVLQEMVLPKANQDQDSASPTADSSPTRFNWRIALGNRWCATLTIVLLAALLGFSGEVMSIWPVFGASNQLLAALTLLCVTLWLLRNKRPVLFALLPMVFMMLISVWALVCLLIDKLRAQNWPLVIACINLLFLAACLVVLAGKRLAGRKDKPVSGN